MNTNLGARQAVGGRSPRLVWVLLAIFGAVVAAGCDGASNKATPPTPPSEAELAERHFNNFVAEVRRRLKESRSTRPASLGGPMVNLTTEVTDELIPPPSEGLAWRGKLTVTTRSSVTVISVPDEQEDEEKSGRKRSDDNFGPLGSPEETDNPALVENYSELKSSRAADKRSKSSSLMQVIDDDKVEEYDLIFEDGRWRLITPVDEDTAMGLILDIALKSQ